MENKIKNINYSPKKIMRWFYISISVLTLIFLACISVFLYKNFYQIITQSEEILLLRQKVVIETVDMDIFEEVIEKIEKKPILKNQLTLGVYSINNKNGKQYRPHESFCFIKNLLIKKPADSRWFLFIVVKNYKSLGAILRNFFTIPGNIFKTLLISSSVLSFPRVNLMEL